MTNDQEIVYIDEDDLQTLVDVFGEEFLKLVVETDPLDPPEDSILH